MEGHRYAHESDPSRYSGRGRHDPDVSGSHATGNPYESGIHERPSGAFRLPEQRPYAVTETGSHARPAEVESRYPVRGPEFPTVKPGPAPGSMAEPAPLMPPGAAARQPDSVYRTRRPASAFVVAVVMSVLMIPVVRLLIDSTFAGRPVAQAIVPAVLLTLGFALTGIGLILLLAAGLAAA